MAAIAKTNITIIRSWWDTVAQQKVVMAKITIPKSDANTYGDETNTIPASAFGLQVVEEVSPIRYYDTVLGGDRIILAAPFTSTTNACVRINTYNLAVVTDADRSKCVAMLSRIDASNDRSYYCTVKGY